MCSNSLTIWLDLHQIFIVATSNKDTSHYTRVFDLTYFSRSQRYLLFKVTEVKLWNFDDICTLPFPGLWFDLHHKVTCSHRICMLLSDISSKFSVQLLSFQEAPEFEFTVHKIFPTIKIPWGQPACCCCVKVLSLNYDLDYVEDIRYDMPCLVPGYRNRKEFNFHSDTLRINYWLRRNYWMRNCC
jgi:hypothetical protein